MARTKQTAKASQNEAKSILVQKRHMKTKKGKYDDIKSNFRKTRLKEMCHAGGAKRIEGACYPILGQGLHDMAQELLRKSIIIRNYMKKTQVTADHVFLAAKCDGINLAGLARGRSRTKKQIKASKMRKSKKPESETQPEQQISESTD